MTRLPWARVAVLVVALVTLGCATASSYLRLSNDERRLFEVYSVFMPQAEQAEYLHQPTGDARKVYAESLGLPQRLAALPEKEREAVLHGIITRGMSGDGLLMAWGPPYSRSFLGRRNKNGCICLITHGRCR